MSDQFTRRSAPTGQSDTASGFTRRSMPAGAEITKPPENPPTPVGSFLSDLGAAWNGEKDTSAHRGTLAPVVRESNGAKRLGAPTLLQDVVRGVSAPRRSMDSGSFDPEEEARNLASIFTGTSVASRAAPAATAVVREGAEAVGKGAKATGEAVDRFKASGPGSPATPSRADITTLTDHAYKEAYSAGAVAKPEAFEGFMQDLPNALMATNRTRVKSTLHPQAQEVLNNLETYRGRPLGLEELDDLQRETDDIIRTAAAAANRGEKKADYRAANIIGDQIDRFVNSLASSPEKLAGGDAAAAVAALNKGRELAARGRKLDMLKDIVDVADDLRTPDYIKERFTAIRKNKRDFNQFAPDEQKLIVKAARTGLMDGVGKLLGSVTAAVGLGRGIGAAAAGTAAKTGGRLGRRGAVNQLQEKVAQGARPPARPLYDRVRLALGVDE